MISAEPELRKRAASVKASSFRNAAAVLFAALCIAWPAFYNGSPLVYPDTMTYVDDGRIVARALFLHRFSDYYGMLSFFYSLGILPLHWNVTLWPVAALQCLLVAFVLWLVVRSIAPDKTILPYLALVLLLSAVTGMSWYSALILPDILGPVLYLSIYLLVFARETLSRVERLTLYAIAWWAVTSHATHLMLAVFLCALLAAWSVIGRRGFAPCIRYVGEVAAIVGLAVIAQLALNSYLYGKPSLNGERPAFLTARIIADGPGRWYLEKHCAELNWVICDHVRNLPGDPDNFLWGADGIYQNGSDSDNERMIQDEVPFVLATLRAYPRAQISRSAANSWGQLTSFGFEDLDASSWVQDEFEAVIPRARSSYLRSRQARNDLPLDRLAIIQTWAVGVSLVVIAVFVPLIGRRRGSDPHFQRIAGLGVVIVSMIVANALVTGTLSMVEDRFECRVIWLMPLLAGMCVVDWSKRRSRPSE